MEERDPWTANVVCWMLILSTVLIVVARVLSTIWHFVSRRPSAKEHDGGHDSGLDSEH